MNVKLLALFILSLFISACEDHNHETVTKGNLDIIIKAKYGTEALVVDQNYIYFSYFGLKELFEKIEKRKITFDEMKEHEFIKLLKEKELLFYYDEIVYYGKFEIYCNINDNELSSNISLAKIPIIKLNLEITNIMENKEKSVMKMFGIREKK